MSQMSHPVTKDRRIDLPDVVLAKVENLEERKTGERIRRKFVDRVSSKP